MKTKFFESTAIHSTEDIKTAIDRFNSFVFVNNERNEALAELSALIDEYNDELKSNALFAVVNSGDIFNALIPAITIGAEEVKSATKRKRAVYNAVSYPQWRLTEKDGKHELRAIEKAVTLRDIHTALCNLYATEHADRKITKCDREKAMTAIMSADTLQALRLFMYGAYRFENIADKVARDWRATITEENAIFTEATPSKNNAEKQIKLTAQTIGLENIAFKRAHALTLYKRAYTIDRYQQPKVADILDFAHDFIISARYAKNNIELPDMLDKGGIFAVEEQVKTENIITF